MAREEVGRNGRDVGEVLVARDVMLQYIMKEKLRYKGNRKLGICREGEESEVMVGRESEKEKVKAEEDER